MVALRQEIGERPVQERAEEKGRESLTSYSTGEWTLRCGGGLGLTDGPEVS
jgi:hypothetical protein